MSTFANKYLRERADMSFSPDAPVEERSGQFATGWFLMTGTGVPKDERKGLSGFTKLPSKAISQLSTIVRNTGINGIKLSNDEPFGSYALLEVALLLLVILPTSAVYRLTKEKK